MKSHEPGPPSAIPCSDLHTEVWDRLQAAADDRSHPMRLHTMATVDSDGRPDARLMMLRGAQREHAFLWYHSDVRSRKVAQLTALHRACMVCYDHRDGAQIRLWGGVSVHCDDQLAHQHWEQVDLAVRRAYALPQISGQPIPHPDLRMRDHSAQVASGDSEVGRANLAVLELQVDTIEWLQVLDTGDCRAVMHVARDWSPEPLVP